MYAYILICMCICIYTSDTYMYIHTYIHTYTFVCTSKYMYYTYEYTYMYLYMYMYVMYVYIIAHTCFEWYKIWNNKPTCEQRTVKQPQIMIKISLTVRNISTNLVETSSRFIKPETSAQIQQVEPIARDKIEVLCQAVQFAVLFPSLSVEWMLSARGRGKVITLAFVRVWFTARTWTVFSENRTIERPTNLNSINCTPALKSIRHVPSSEVTSTFNEGIDWEWQLECSPNICLEHCFVCWSKFHDLTCTCIGVGGWWNKLSLVRFHIHCHTRVVILFAENCFCTHVIWLSCVAEGGRKGKPSVFIEASCVRIARVPVLFVVDLYARADGVRIKTLWSLRLVLVPCTPVTNHLTGGRMSACKVQTQIGANLLRGTGIFADTRLDPTRRNTLLVLEQRSMIPLYCQTSYGT